MTDAGITNGRNELSAVEKSILLLRALRGQGSHGGLGVSELARRSGLSKSTAYRLAGALVDSEMVERTQDGRYRIGAGLVELVAPEQSFGPDRIRDVMTPFVAELYELTHETVHLAVLRGSEIVYLSKLFGHRSVRAPSRIGQRLPAHCTSLGKAILANDTHATQAAFQRGLIGLTQRSITDQDVLREQLARIQRDGLAFDDEEVEAGVSCVGVAITLPSGRAIAALSVSGPTTRLDTRLVAESVRRVGHAASRAAACAAAPPPPHARRSA